MRWKKRRVWQVSKKDLPGPFFLEKIPPLEGLQDNPVFRIIVFERRGPSLIRLLVALPILLLPLGWFFVFFILPDPASAWGGSVAGLLIVSSLMYGQGTNGANGDPSWLFLKGKLPVSRDFLRSVPLDAGTLAQGLVGVSAFRLNRREQLMVPLQTGLTAAVLELAPDFGGDFLVLPFAMTLFFYDLGVHTGTPAYEVLTVSRMVNWKLRKLGDESSPSIPSRFLEMLTGSSSRGCFSLALAVFMLMGVAVTLEGVLALLSVLATTPTAVQMAAPLLGGFAAGRLRAHTLDRQLPVLYSQLVGRCGRLIDLLRDEDDRIQPRRSAKA